MEILYLLIPLSAVLVLLVLAVFGWAVQRGQFEDLEYEGERILLHDRRDDPQADMPAFDDGQGPPLDQHEQSKASDLSRIEEALDGTRQRTGAPGI